MQFDDAATYQVNVSLIEKLADIKLPKAIDSYTDERNMKLVLEEIDIDPELESDSIEQKLGFTNFQYCFMRKPAHSRSTLASSQPTHKPKVWQKETSASPARVTAFQVGFRIAHDQKNKINLCFVDRLVQLDNDKKIKLNK